MAYQKNKDNDECDPNPNNKFPDLMDCELSVTGKNIDEKILNEFIGNQILKHNMMTSSADLHKTFVQYSENVLSQMNPSSFLQLDFMEILDNYNIMYFFYDTRLFLYENILIYIRGRKKRAVSCSFKSRIFS